MFPPVLQRLLQGRPLLQAMFLPVLLTERLAPRQIIMGVLLLEPIRACPTLPAELTPQRVRTRPIQEARRLIQRPQQIITDLLQLVTRGRLDLRPIQTNIQAQLLTARLQEYMIPIQLRPGRPALLILTLTQLRRD